LSGALYDRERREGKRKEWKRTKEEGGQERGREGSLPAGSPYPDRKRNPV